jgi:hypothetical protein
MKNKVKEEQIKKYNLNYSHLSKLILEMSDEQQSFLLTEAKNILSDKNRKLHFYSRNQSTYWPFIIGFNSAFLLFFILIPLIFKHICILRQFVIF